MRVLHVSHTATISGGEHSLLTLLAGMPPEIELGVACPDGPLARAVRDLGLPVYAIPATTASFRLHPVRTPRATVEMGGAALAVSRIARREGATVLHANSVRAGLVTGLAGTIGGPPGAVHVRDVLPANATAAAVKRVLTSRSAELIAISEYVKERFGGNGNGHSPTVIDNAVNRRRFDPDAYDRAECRRRLGVETQAPLIGIVGQITPWKGHDVAVRALRLVMARYPEARLLVVGEVKFSGPETSLDNRGFLRRLHELVDELDLSGHVSFLGEREDVPQILRALDALLVPSTVEPFGRTVAEAMTMATPVIATSEGGPFELLHDGVSGLLVPPGDEHAWARAIERLLDDPAATRRMAVAARGVAMSRFDTARHVRSVLEVLSAASGSGNGASP